MNLKNLKLGLTIDLMNNSFNGNAIARIKEKIASFNGVGQYLGARLMNSFTLNDEHEQQDYSIQFEHVVLDLQVVSHRNNSCQFVSGFEIMQA